MTDDRKKSGLSFGMTLSIILGLLLAVAYPLSYGPACWLLWNGYLPRSTAEPLDTFYSPLSYAAEESEIFGRAHWWYLGFWNRNRTPQPVFIDGEWITPPTDYVEGEWVNADGSP